MRSNFLMSKNSSWLNEFLKKFQYSYEEELGEMIFNLILLKEHRCFPSKYKYFSS